MNTLDRLISYFSPAAGAKRLAHRRANSIRMYYDGATRSHRANGWAGVGASGPNAPFSLHGTRLRDIGRDLVRNNAFARRAKTAIVSNTVGRGILPSIDARSVQNKRRFEQLLIDHFDTTAIDATGRHNLYGLQALVLGTVIESGEALVRLRRRRPSDGLPLPFQIEVLEGDYLDSAVDGIQPNGSVAIKGVEYDKIGGVRGYHLFDHHPNNGYGAQPQSRFVPAELVAHIFRQERPNQARGVSWFAPVVLQLNDLSDYRSAQLLRQKIAACFAAFVSTDSNELVNLEDEETAAGHPLEAFEPGMIERLAPGQQVSFSAPPAVQDYTSFTKSTLLEVAAGLDISYEALTGDLSGSNFSSSRMGWLEFQRSIDNWRDHLLVPQFLNRLEGWFFEAAGIMGSARSMRDPVRIKWTPPRREMISPKDEIGPLKEAVKAGFRTRSDVVRSFGMDPEALEIERAEENARAEKLGVKYDTDQGAIQIMQNLPAGGEGEPPQTEDDEERETEQAA